MGYSGDSLATLGRPELMRDAQERTVSRVGEKYLAMTVEHTPVAKPPPGVEAEWLQSRHGRKPGTLRDSWRLGTVTVGEGLERKSIDVYTLDQIAPYVEYPTMPHIIVPRKPGGMLRFWDEFGHTIYATIVHHTGTKGSYMLTTATAELGVEWESIGEDELARWASEAAAAAR